MNKKALKITSLKDNDEIGYWLSKTPAERLRAVEINMRLVYGFAQTSRRLQRFFEVVDLKKQKSKRASQGY
jgi:hypothetical protein